MEYIQENFIIPGSDITKDFDEIRIITEIDKETLKSRWTTIRGNNILEQWKESGFDRTVLESLVGKYYDHIDLRGISLKGLELKSADLSKIDFFGSDFSNTIFENCSFENSWLSQSCINGSVFKFCSMKDVLIDNMTFDHKTSFVGINLNEINLTFASLLQRAVLNQQRITELEHSHPHFSRFLKYSCDYGRSITRWLIWFVGVILFFGVLYSIGSPTNSSGLLNGIYFSFVTFTTLGFGDITPITAVGKIYVIAEVLIGYVMSGLLVAIIAKKILGD